MSFDEMIKLKIKQEELLKSFNKKYFNKTDINEADKAAHLQLIKENDEAIIKLRNGNL